MERKTLNRVLGEALAALMQQHGLSANSLGKKARVAPNTIGNYLKAKGAEFTATGKEKSAKLTEIERLADALD